MSAIGRRLRSFASDLESCRTMEDVRRECHVDMLDEIAADLAATFLPEVGARLGDFARLLDEARSLPDVEFDCEWRRLEAMAVEVDVELDYAGDEAFRRELREARP